MRIVVVARRGLMLLAVLSGGCKGPAIEPVAPTSLDSPRVPALGDTPGAAPDPEEIIDVSAGVDSTCVVKGDGAVLCVGAGVGLDESRQSHDLSTPRRIEGIPPMVEVEAGEGLWCARTAEGEVYCWQRSNRYEDEDVTVPRKLALAAPALELVVRGRFGCARTESAIECWPDFGALPLDFTYDSWAMVASHANLQDRLELCFTQGGSGGCTDSADSKPEIQVPRRERALHALRDLDGSFTDLRCWLEPGGTLDCLPKVAVPQGAGLHVTGSGACWHASDGRLFCTGDNRSGQLGRAGAESLLGAIQIEGVPQLVQVSVGSNHVCGLTHDRRLWCWGRAAEGQLGHAAGVVSTTPVRADVDGVQRVVAGGDRTCVRTDEGWRCSGFVEGKRCGRATMSLPLRDVGPAAQVLIGGSELCVREGEALKCGRLFETSLVQKSEFGPREPLIHFDVAESTPGLVVVLDDDVCMQDRKGGVGCGGKRSWKPSKPLDMLVGGAWHMCGLRRDGKVECADAVDHEGTVQDLGLRGRPQQIASYGNDLCVIESDQIHCFGVADEEHAIMPMTIEGLSDQAKKAVAVGRSLACALDREGTVACWDLLDGVQFYAYPETFTAREVPLPEPAVELAVGLRHACARTGSGALYCWGDDHAGQLGDGAALCEFSPADRTEAFSRR